MQRFIPHENACNSTVKERGRNLCFKYVYIESDKRLGGESEGLKFDFRWNFELQICFIEGVIFSGALTEKTIYD